MNLAIVLNMSHQSWQNKIDKANASQKPPKKIIEKNKKIPENSENNNKNYDDLDEYKRKMIANFK